MTETDMVRPRGVRELLRSWVSGMQQALEEPIVPVTVYAPWPGASDDPAVMEACRLAAERVVQEYLAALALPGRARAVVEQQEMSGGGTGLDVHGLRLRCAAEDVTSVVSALSGRDELRDVTAERSPAVVDGLCRAALLGRLSALLGPEQTELLLNRSQVPLEDARRNTVADAVRLVLDIGVPLPDGTSVRTTAMDVDRERHPAEIAEQLIELRRPRTLDLLMARGTLRALTVDDTGNADMFVLIRSQLFAETGILGPDFRLLVDETVPQQCVVMKANAVRSWPRPVLPAGSLWALGSVLDGELRRRVSWFIGGDAVGELLTPLKWALPDTVESVLARYPLTWLAAVARALVDEGVSVRRVATVLDRLLDLNPERLPRGAFRMTEMLAPSSATGDPTYLPSPRDVVVALRQATREEAARLSRDQLPVMVRRLSPAVEELLLAAVTEGPPPAGGADAERAAADVRGWASQSTGTPLLVPDLDVRAWLRQALRAEFPGIQVLATAELHPATNVVEVPAVR